MVTFLLIHMNLLIYAKRFGDQPTAGKTSGRCELLSQVRDLQNDLQSGATDEQYKNLSLKVVTLGLCNST